MLRLRYAKLLGVSVTFLALTLVLALQGCLGSTRTPSLSITNAENSDSETRKPMMFLVEKGVSSQLMMDRLGPPTQRKKLSIEVDGAIEVLEYSFSAKVVEARSSDRSIYIASLQLLVDRAGKVVRLLENPNSPKIGGGRTQKASKLEIISARLPIDSADRILED